MFRSMRLVVVTWLAAFIIVVGCVLCVDTGSALAETAQPAGQVSDPATAPRKITCVGLVHETCDLRERQVGLGDELVVHLDGSAAIDPAGWLLYLDGRVVTEAKAARLSDDGRGLIFALRRTDAVAPAWNALLGAPTSTARKVTVSVGPVGSPSTPRLSGATPIEIDLALFRPWAPFFAVVAVLLLGRLVFVHLQTSSLLRDRLLDQVPMPEQPFSLGRMQMAFWFVLILLAYVFLGIYLGDTNTMSSQALTLMGISAATGLGAIAANGFNNDALKAADKALKDALFVTAQDVIDLRDQIAKAPADDPQLQGLKERLALWTKLTRDYVTKDPFSDIINDDNGAALHRLQIVAWTVVLGGVFVIGVWQSLAMPAFSETLLALMGVSGGSYVGFKVAEKT